ncbi:MAG: metallophosphatase family protein [Pseudomonadota bacterium]|nr:metallophosphatase family protein [Pseudomonadota bacterium]
MLIAILSDIHGNREALEACLEDAARRGAERFVFLGDFVGYGADPVWVVETARAAVAAGALALRGNHDEALLTGGGGMNALARAAIDWTRDQLGPEQLRFLADLPLAAEEDPYLFVHANAWAPGAWGYVTGPVEAERSLRCTAAQATFCGHTHVPALFQIAPDKPAVGFRPVSGCAVPLLRQRRWLAVVPAVGQPRDGDPDAGYALLDPEKGTVTFRRVTYDVEAAARKIVAAGLPPRLASRLLEGR